MIPTGILSKSNSKIEPSICCFTSNFDGDMALGIEGAFSAKQLANLTPTSPVMASYGSECAVLIGRLKCQPRAIPEPTPAGQSLPLGV